MKTSKAALFLILFSIPLVAVISQCSINAPKVDPRGSLYAGSASCRQCHSDIYNNYLHTAHFSSTRLADKSSVSGSFVKGLNTYLFSKDDKVLMINRADGLYQAAYQNGKEINAKRLDITVGGIKAESYLYWEGNRLRQLPISYFEALHQWTNSPGYDSTFADFSRPITVGCLECHSSYIKAAAIQSGADSLKNSRFDKNTLIMGIDCERCHGPAGDHVYYQTTHPEDTHAQHIITYASLTREQKINMCAVCHSGSKGTMLRSTFGFKPVDNLHDYKIEDVFQTTAAAKLDVHGDQSRLLQSSRCFLMSKMDCASCHNLHKNERGQLLSFSQKCITCHSESNHNFCKMANLLGDAIKTNCIDCHMPAKPSDLITVGTSGMKKAAPYVVRTHHIAVYEEEAKKVIAALNQTKTHTSR